TPSTPVFRLDTFCRAAVRSCCSGLKRYAMLLARCLLTNSRCTRLRRTIAVFRSACTKSFLPPSVQRNNRLRTDATRRNKTSRWKNRAQRKPAQPGDAVLESGQLSYAHEIVLRSNPFSNPGDSSRCVVVTRGGRSGKSIRHKLRTTHDIRVSHGSGDFGMRREQPKFPRAESEGRAMEPRCGKHRGV